jgi:plastocyanin
MLLPADYQRAIRDTISGYPYASLLYKAGDPRLLAQLNAMAVMLGMASQQIEVAMMEPFSKVRDATILADAALKGMLPMAIPTQVQVTITNPTATAWSLTTGRQLYDSSGNIWKAQTAVTVAGGGTGVATLMQITSRTVPATIGASAPFTAIQVPPPPDDTNFIAGIIVTRDSDDQQFTYQPNFVNVNVGDEVYTVETDEYRNLYVKFGYDNVVGYQPGAGESFTLTITDCAGNVTPDVGSPFSLEYISLPIDSQMQIAMTELLVPGAAPMTTATLRELSKYPSVYDVNAVYLGEFDRMVRLAVPNLVFLSIWNEQLEESVRGPSVNNINKLFVAVLPAAGGDLTATQTLIKNAILAADDSYQVEFVTAVNHAVTAAVTAKVSIVNDPAVVTSQINAAILGVYGIGTTPTTRGMLVMQNTALTDAIRANVDAMTDKKADLTVALTLPTTLLPEQHLFISAGTISVTVIPQTENLGNWGV